MIVGSALPSHSSYSSLPAYWDADGFHWLSPSGVTSGAIQCVSQDGRTSLGTWKISNLDRLFLHDHQSNTTIELPLNGLQALPSGKFAIHSQGYVLAPAKTTGNIYGMGIWSKNASGNWFQELFLPKASTSQTFMNLNGDPLVAGTITHTDGKTHVFTWDPTLGYQDLGTVGGLNARVTAMSEQGTFGGSASIVDPLTGAVTQKAFISRWDETAQLHQLPFLAIPAGAFSTLNSINEHGEALGSITTNGQTKTGLWRGLQNFFPFSEIVHHPSAELLVTGASSLSRQGLVIASGSINTVWTNSLVLQPDGDTDDDGLPDIFENQHQLNPFFPADSTADPDNDGLTSLQEFQNQTSWLL